MDEIRVRVAGLYIENKQILLVKHRKDGQEYYLLPGGGQNSGESMTRALEREWQEELNVEIITGNYLFSGESIPPLNSNKRHVLQVVFEVNKVNGNILLSPDNTLIDFEWIPLAEINSIKLYPFCKNQIFSVINGQKPELYMTYNWQDG